MNEGFVNVDDAGTIHLPSISVPLSELSSEEAKASFMAFAKGFDSLTLVREQPTNTAAINRQLDELLMAPGVQLLRSRFPVSIKPETIGGVQTDIVEPAAGVVDEKKKCVLINLHGGAFMYGARLGGQMEAIPIASLGGYKVITVDYRQSPEHVFPAASEDVASVYAELLKTHAADKIGIYGCSAGGVLTSEALAWFDREGLPMPGAVGMFGAGAIATMLGDSAYISQPIQGMGLQYPAPPPPGSEPLRFPYFGVDGLDLYDPLVSPAFSPSLMAKFPPTLLINSTRDMMLSSCLFTHRQLLRAGVEAELHVFEGVPHGWFSQPIVNPAEPETQDAWNTVVRFFDNRLAGRM